MTGKAFLLALVSTATRACVARNSDYFPLVELQKILQSGLDEELKYFAEDHDSPIRDDVGRKYHTKRRSYMRKKEKLYIAEEEARNAEKHKDTESDPIYLQRLKWNHLVKHAWKIAESVNIDDDEGIMLTSEIREASPCPFLICTQQTDPAADVSSYEHTLGAFNKTSDESILVSSAQNQTCAIIMATAYQVREVVSSEEDLQAIPLVDAVKIHTGTADEVSSHGWAVPYGSRSADDENEFQPRMNETEMIHQWERILEVDFSPGIGGMKDEAILLDVVNHMMEDIQDMGQAGWALREKRDEMDDIDRASAYLIPTISSVFSLTATSGHQTNNHPNHKSRLDFWKNAIETGLETEHICSEMFNTLFVKPRKGYFGFDLVLNPQDGPPPVDFDSSASNPACVTSLVAALSTHPHVLSVKANFPMYYGWHVAHKIGTI